MSLVMDKLFEMKRRFDRSDNIELPSQCSPQLYAAVSPAASQTTRRQ